MCVVASAVSAPGACASEQFTAEADTVCATAAEGVTECLIGLNKPKPADARVR